MNTTRSDLEQAAATLGIGITETSSTEELVVSILLRMSDLKLRARCRMGKDAFGDPYWAYLQPLQVKNSPQGIRVQCDCQPDPATDTMIYSGGVQGSGRKRLLASAIDEIQLTNEPFKDLSGVVKLSLGESQ